MYWAACCMLLCHGRWNGDDCCAMLMRLCQKAPISAITAHAVPGMMGDSSCSMALAITAMDPANRVTSSVADAMLHRDEAFEPSWSATGSCTVKVASIVTFSSPKNFNKPLVCNAVDSHARYRAMTKRSAAAMELNSAVVVCLVECDDDWASNARAVAKKLMDPPM